MHRFANPTRFLRLAGYVLPWTAGSSAALFALGLTLALFVAPPAAQQGEAVRIMDVHVPSAWMALFVYLVVAASSAVSLIWKHPLADLVAKAASPVGAAFTVIALVTGSLWGKPMWNTYWVWDARLTSVLILLFLYLGHMALINAFDDTSRGSRAAAILALVGVVNLPIIKFSVEWWSTLHQPASVLRLDGPTIHPSMLWPLIVMALAFKLYFVSVLILRVRGEIAARKLRSVRLQQAAQGAAAAG